MKKGNILQLLLAAVILLGLVLPASVISASSAPPAGSVPIKAKGNQLVTADGTETPVVLRGANIPSLGWGNGEHLTESIRVACDEWNSNLIRLAVSSKSYTTNESYRQTVKRMVSAVNARGKYIIIDCHSYIMPDETDFAMWDMISKDPELANHPAVLYGLCNEPHHVNGVNDDAGRSEWDIWKNGGEVSYGGRTFHTDGHQALVELIRNNGAENILVAAGIGWGYILNDLVDTANDCLNEYALVDRGGSASSPDLSKAGNGIMYDSHVYPNKENMVAWNNRVGAMRKYAPILIGEFGVDTYDAVATGNNMTDSAVYTHSFLDWMDDRSNKYDGVPLNWTGWNMHPTSSPRMIRDWTFDPTSFNGVYVKERLLGYSAPASYDAQYTNDFSSDSFTYTYSHETNKDTEPAVPYTTVQATGGALEIQYTNTKQSDPVVMNFPVEWMMNGLESFQLDLSAAAGRYQLGILDSDTELWTKEVTADGSSHTITVRVDELAKQNNVTADGLLNGTALGIYLKPLFSGPWSATVDNVKLTTSSAPTIAAPYTPYVTHPDTIIDFEDGGLSAEASATANGSGLAILEPGTGVGTDGKDAPGSKALRASFHKGTVGQLKINFTPEMRENMRDAKYFSFCTKMEKGANQAVDLNLAEAGGKQYGDGANVKLEDHKSRYYINTDGETGWVQHIYTLESFALTTPENITTLNMYLGNIYSGAITDDVIYIDNLCFTKEKPEQIPVAEKTAVYPFRETGNWKDALGWDYINQDSDTISGGFYSEGHNSPQGYLFQYNRANAEPAVAKAKITGPDFKKAWPAWGDIRGMNYLLLDVKSTSGAPVNLSISLNVGDEASNKYYYYTTNAQTVTATTSWKTIAIPIDSFQFQNRPVTSVNVCNINLSVADQNISGGLLVDNLAFSTRDRITIDEDYSNEYGLLTESVDVFTGSWETESQPGKAGGMTAQKAADSGYLGSPGLTLTMNSGMTYNKTSSTPDHKAVMENCLPADYDFSSAGFLSAMIHGSREYSNGKNTSAVNKLAVEFWSNQTDLTKPAATFTDDFNSGAEISWTAGEEYDSPQTAAGEGQDASDALRFTPSQTDRQIQGKLPAGWNLSEMNGAAWVSFWIRPSDKDTIINLSFYDESGGLIDATKWTGKLSPAWQKVTFQFSSLAAAKAFRLGHNKSEILFDDFTISNQDQNPQLAATATFDAAADSWSDVTVPLTFPNKNADLSKVRSVKIFNALNEPTAADGNDLQVILSQFRLRGLKPETREKISGDFTYQATFSVDGAMDTSEGYYSSDTDYFAKVRDWNFGKDGSGLNIQYNMAEPAVIPAGKFAYVEGSLPVSWDLARTDTMNFDVNLAGKLDNGTVVTWMNRKAAIGQLGAPPEPWENGLKPVFALVDDFGNTYSASIALEFINGWETVSIPLSSFRNEAGYKPDLNTITKYRIYPDPDKRFGAFYLDNLTFTKEGSIDPPPIDPPEEFTLDSIAAKNGNTDLTTAGLIPGAAQITAAFSVPDGAAQTITLVAALYQDGRLEQVKTLDSVSVSPAQPDVQISLDIPADVSGCSLKVFVWNGKADAVQPFDSDKARLIIPARDRA